MGSAALAWGLAGYAGGAPGPDRNLPALGVICLRLSNDQRYQHRVRAKQFESSKSFSNELTRHTGYRMARLPFEARNSGTRQLIFRMRDHGYASGQVARLKRAASRARDWTRSRMRFTPHWPVI